MFSFFRRAFSMWMEDSLVFSLFNLLWLLAQVTVIAGPPATVALFALARRSADEQYIEWSQAWQGFRENFGSAWKWGLVNLLVLLTLVVNFWTYHTASSLSTTLLRFGWGAILLIWLAVNQFTWPFYLLQRQRSLLTALKNSFLFLAHRPGMVIGMLLISLLLGLISLLLVIPMAFLLASWLALASTLAVDEEISRTSLVEARS